MTLPEKVGQMLQLDARGDLDDLVCSKLAGSLLHASPERMLEARALVATTRLQIPLLMADDCIHGHSFWPGATIFPTQLGMACTWDPDLVERGARAAAVEIAATGLHWTFSPVLCIARDLRWGRVDETFGEDPHLIGELGAAMIRGYQGDGLLDRTAVLATAKHFAGYSETQGGRDASEADLTPRKLRAWFFPPFEKAVAVGCRTFMLGYQAIDGVPVTANRWLLNDVLKQEWGFTGTLVTDWDNVGRMVWEQKVCATDVEAATVAVDAGNDLIMTTPQFFAAAQEAVARGDLREALIDQAVRRILTLKFELGLFEDPRSPDPVRQADVIGCPGMPRSTWRWRAAPWCCSAMTAACPLTAACPRRRRSGLPHRDWPNRCDRGPECRRPPRSARGLGRRLRADQLDAGRTPARSHDHRPRRVPRHRPGELDHHVRARRGHRPVGSRPGWRDLPGRPTQAPAVRVGRG